jgi:hypothetical protein
MNIDKINEILKNVDIKSNKDLIGCRDALADEFEKTKTIIIELTKHLDLITENYDLVNNEIGKRLK